MLNFNFSLKFNLFRSLVTQQEELGALVFCPSIAEGLLDAGPGDRVVQEYCSFDI